MSKTLNASIGEALGRSARIYRRWANAPATDDPAQLQDAQDLRGLINALRRAAVEAAGLGESKWFWRRWIDRRYARRFLKNWAEEIEG